MQRKVQAEILDGLPACNLDAIASRRDLRKINFLMGNFRWIESKLLHSPAIGTPRYLELGAGDGTLARRILRKYPDAQYSALDLTPKPEDFPGLVEWLREDCLKFDAFGDYTHILANLFLHHFEADALKEMGKRINESGVNTLIACEPCRRELHQWQLRAGKWIGFNWVTLSDGCTSVEAGFRGEELPQLLGLPPDQWTWTVHETIMGAYRLHATRR